MAADEKQHLQSRAHPLTGSYHGKVCCWNICIYIRHKLVFLVRQIGLKWRFNKVLDHKDDSQENRFIKPLKATLKVEYLRFLLLFFF